MYKVTKTVKTKAGDSYGNTFDCLDHIDAAARFYKLINDEIALFCDCWQVDREIALEDLKGDDWEIEFSGQDLFRLTVVDMDPCLSAVTEIKIVKA